MYAEEPFIVAELKTVRSLLENIGYITNTSDEAILRFCIDNVRNTIKNTIHRKDVPKGLKYVVIKRTIGEFLKTKKTFAPDDIAGLDLSSAVKQIQEGDVNVVFTTGDGSLTSEQRLDSLISHFLAYGQDEIMHYRRLVW